MLAALLGTILCQERKSSTIYDTCSSKQSGLTQYLVAGRTIAAASAEGKSVEYFSLYYFIIRNKVLCPLGKNLLFLKNV